MRPHPTDLLSLIAGVVFVAIGLGHLLGAMTSGFPLGALRFWPLLIVAGGIALLSRTRRRTDDT